MCTLVNVGPGNVVVFDRHRLPAIGLLVVLIHWPTLLFWESFSFPFYFYICSIVSFWEWKAPKMAATKRLSLLTFSTDWTMREGGGWGVGRGGIGSAAGSNWPPHVKGNSFRLFFFFLAVEDNPIASD
jgi:hypothetical protein